MSIPPGVDDAASYRSDSTMLDEVWFAMDATPSARDQFIHNRLANKTVNEKFVEIASAIFDMQMQGMADLR